MAEGDRTLDPDLLEFRLIEFQALEWIDYVKSLPPIPPNRSATAELRVVAHEVVRGSREQFLAPALAVLGWDRPAPAAE